jgi:hypothetical protein
MFVWVAMTVAMVGWELPRGLSALRRHRHLSSRSEFHKTCAGVVDDIGYALDSIETPKRFWHDPSGRKAVDRSSFNDNLYRRVETSGHL